MTPIRSLIISLAAIFFFGVSTAHAQWSLNGVKVFYNAGNVGIGTNNPAYTLDVRTATIARAIFGYNSAAAGTMYAIYGRSDSTGGFGVYGLANAGTGTNYGVYGRTNSTTGRAMYALANAGTGVNYGIVAKTNSATGYALHATGGRNYLQGKVGIGVAAPAEMLHVAGNALITGWIGNTADAAVDIRSNNVRVFRVKRSVDGGNNESANIIGGFGSNVIGSTFTGSTIGGGGTTSATNAIQASFATIAGGRNNKINTGSFFYGTIGGGNTNTITGIAGTIAGGQNNTAPGMFSAIGGGNLNSTSGLESTVAGGAMNAADGNGSFIGGGSTNTASGLNSTVAGGANNNAIAMASAIGGGDSNHAAGWYSAVPGGRACFASNDYTFAAGRRAKATQLGSFVWADSTDADFISSANNQFNVRASGGTRIFSNTAATVGVELAAGGNSWSALSDRNAKTNITPIDSRKILAKVASLPITRWNLISQDESIHHIGPMAQDFHAAFGIGEDNRRITQTDADGVALAAIQGLHHLVNEKESEIASLRAEKDAQIADLSARLARLETFVNSIAISSGQKP